MLEYTALNYIYIYWLYDAVAEWRKICCTYGKTQENCYKINIINISKTLKKISEFCVWSIRFYVNGFFLEIYIKRE